jgi:beta-lactam-binding protein with PASTA domain
MSNFTQYLKTKSFRTNLIAAICTFFALLLIAFFSLRYYTKHGEGLNVPNLRGTNITDAISKLEGLGLRYEVDSVYVMDQPPGMVTDQDPDPGTFVKDNRTIYLTINTNTAPNVRFPDIETKSLREAKSIIESYGLKLGDTTYKPDVAQDVVLEVLFGGQPIRPGESLPKGSRVNFVLGDGRGNEEVDLPNLTGLTLDEASFSLKGSMLSIGTITYEGNITDTANAIIVNQFPLPVDSVTKVRIGTPINLTLANKQP